MAAKNLSHATDPEQTNVRGSTLGLKSSSHLSDDLQVMSETDMTPTAAAGEFAATEGALKVHAVESPDALDDGRRTNLRKLRKLCTRGISSR